MGELLQNVIDVLQQFAVLLVVVHERFLQRARTALRAMAERFEADSFAARALPPLDAPSFDSATAAGFRVSGSGEGSGACPVASCTICHASWFASRGRFLRARAGMAHSRTGPTAWIRIGKMLKSKLDQYQLYPPLAGRPGFR